MLYMYIHVINPPNTQQLNMISIAICNLLHHISPIVKM